jgi:hypothetical protein
LSGKKQSRGITILYESPEERLKLGAAASIWETNHFTQEHCAKEVFNLLSELLKKKSLSA